MQTFAQGEDPMSLGDFVDFNDFITPTVMRVIYLIGAIVITFGSLILVLFQAPLLSLYDDSVFHTMRNFMTAIGIMGLIFGNIFWRIFCEFIVVLFKIQASLASIDRTLFDASGKETAEKER
jgi:hypothetical protein